MRINKELPLAWQHLVLSLLALMILSLFHFREFLFVSWHDWIWGISASADPVGVIGLGYSLYTQLLNGCMHVDAFGSFPFGAESPQQYSQFMRPQWWAMGAMMMAQDSPVRAYNIAILLTFSANFVIIYLAARRLFDHWYVALIPATLITFSAYSFAHSYAHLGLLAVFGIPLFFILAIAYLKSPSRRLSIGLGVTAALNLYISAYYFYFSACIALLVIGYYLATKGLPGRAHFTRSVWGIIVLAVLLMPFLHDQYLIDYTNYWAVPEVSRSYSENLDHLYAYSARPSDYLVSNVHSSLLGQYYANFITDLGNRRNLVSDELPIALGACVVLFLIYFAVALFTAKPESPARKAIDRDPFFFGAAGLVMVITFLLSLPPTLEIAGFNVPMLNEFIRQIVPFRSYSRFALIVLCLAVLLMGLVIDRSGSPKLWTAAVILAGTLESHPNFYLHPTYADREYIEFLKSRPEASIMRFEAQAPGNRRRLELESILADKQTMNGQVNNYFATTEWLLDDRPEGFVLGHLADMGTELLLVDGPINFPHVDQAYAQLLREFPEEGIAVWKILPTQNNPLAPELNNLIEKRIANACQVASKSEVKRIMGALFNSFNEKGPGLSQ